MYENLNTQITAYETTLAYNLYSVFMAQASVYCGTEEHFTINAHGDLVTCSSFALSLCRALSAVTPACRRLYLY